MSYTLKGRLESRLTVALAPLLAASGLALAERDWWPLALALLMLVVGVAFDATVYHRWLHYQPGWAAVPLGIAELAVLMGLVRLLDVKAPLAVALGLFAGTWLLGQVLAHAGFPLLRLEYAEDGGELGRLGVMVAATILVFLAAVGGTAWATQRPTIYLSAGVHEGPLVLEHSQELVGVPGAVVRGGVVIRSSDVTVRNLNVEGGRYGIAVVGGVGGISNVVLEDVHIRDAELDGIHARRAQVAVRDCSVGALRSPHAQGIDISFGADLAPSIVERCTVNGGQEGIFIDSTLASVEDNTVRGASLRGITITEMSMGTVKENHVADSIGIGILCSDYSHCDIEENSIVDTRPDHTSDNLLRQGYGVVLNFGAKGYLRDNRFERTPGRVTTFAEATVEQE
jgi:parallel beta helix pectate lyase-like protein